MGTLFARLALAAVLLSCGTLAAQEKAKNRPGTTVQLPTFGISIDAEGTLDAKLFPAVDGKLANERLAAAQRAKPGDLLAESKLRKISLRRLEAAIQRELAVGRAPDDAMQQLAGLTRLQYVFCYPAKNDQLGDIVIAGPAEAWALDPAGRPIGLKSRRPILSLDDLTVALQAFPPGKLDRPFLGCTINPNAEGLAKLVEFQKSVPDRIRDEQRAATTAAVATGVADALGMAEIQVFGISPRTHLAHVLIEADYRMKRIGIGAEPPPVKMTTFIWALDSPREGTLQRWWFTPNYQCLKLTPDNLAAEFIGQGVQLQGEDKLIGADGSLAAAGGPKPGKASELFTLSFTRKYPEIAAASPVYAQLRNVIDLTIAAALIRRHDYYALAGWNAELFRDEASLPTETLPEPKRVPCVVNSLWKGNRLLTPAGGGVFIRPDEALESSNVAADKDGSLARLQSDMLRVPAKDTWWWD